MPITRTGSLHLEVFQTAGDGNQYASEATTVFSAPVAVGDYLATNYRVRGVKFYLDDLLYPHKFPVARLRFKSLLGIEWLGVNASVDEPYFDAANSGQTTRFRPRSPKNIIYPSLGAAMEYAVSKHVLFRIDASGFGWYHRSDFWDADASLSWRVGHVEIYAGGKALHFKTSPKDPEFLIGTFAGALVGVRWHF